LVFVGLWTVPALSWAQWEYTEDLSLFTDLDRVVLRTDYGLYSGWEPWGVGGSLHGFYDSADEEEYGGMIFAGYAGTDTALRIGGGYQQRDQETGGSPVAELRWVHKFDPVADLEFYIQNEFDAAGVGAGIRWHLYADVTDSIDLDILIDASYFEELDEDLDGFAAILFEPLQRIDALHIGPALTLDEEEVRLGLILVVAN
jgi:hypothetical protein